MSRPSLRTIAVTLIALALPLTLLVSQLVTAYLKSNNPDNVDITQGLAYLRPILIAGWVTFGVIMASVAGLIVAMYRRDGNFIEAKLPLILSVLLVIILGGWMAVNSYTDQVEEDYRQAHRTDSQQD